jgi:transcriptional regulator with XRE-family HTH domain
MAKGKAQYWITEEGLLKIGAWARDGLSDKQIADNMGISRSTLNEWKKKYPDISDTIKKDKAVADIQVENALFKRAVGYTVTLKKPIKVKKVSYRDGKKVREEEKVEYAEEELHVPSDTTAAIFYLKNRKPDTWRDKQDVQVSGSLDTEKSKLDDLIKQMRGDG